MMLLKMIQTFGKRRSEEAYKNYLKNSGITSIVLGLFGLVITYFAKFSSFGLGLMTGMTISLLVFGIYFMLIVRYPKRLHKMYIEAYDERNSRILMMTAVATLVFLFFFLFALIALFAFTGITLSYPILLVALLYVLVLGFVILQVIFSKLL
ncbi:MAG: CAAX protease [Streptococcus orisratti]|nr:CAAX protease [Streptococcus orisratti]